MKIAAHATIERVRNATDEQLQNIGQEARYHPSRYAAGKGSKRYALELSCFAWNLYTYRKHGGMYGEIAERCAARAQELIDKYGRES